MSDRAASLMKVGGALAPVMPQSLDEAIRLARGACMAGLVKPQKVGYGENRTDESNDQTEMRAAMTILQGLEIGLPPMQALQLIALINGKMTVHSEGVPALLWARGFEITQWIEGTGDDQIARCRIKRPAGQAIERSFSVVDAKRAGLWSPNARVQRKGKNNSTYEADNDSPWHRYPQRMLAARALGFAARDGAADALRGIWVREEVQDIERVRDITPEPIEREPAQALIEIPDLPTDEPVPDLPVEAEPVEDDDIIADADGVINRIRDDLDAAGDDTSIRDEVLEQYESLIARLPRNRREEAEALFA